MITVIGKDVFRDHELLFNCKSEIDNVDIHNRIRQMINENKKVPKEYGIKFEKGDYIPQHVRDPKCVRKNLILINK